MRGCWPSLAPTTDNFQPQSNTVTCESPVVPTRDISCFFVVCSFSICLLLFNTLCCNSQYASMPMQHQTASMTSSTVPVIKYLSDFAVEILADIVNNLDYISIHNLSVTDTFFRNLIKNDSACQDSLCDAFVNFEFTVYTKEIKSRAMFQVLVSDTRNSLTTHEAYHKHELYGGRKPFSLFGVKVGYYPCYGCFNFRPRRKFFQGLVSGSCTLRGCHSESRCCVDCIMEGSGLMLLRKSSVLADPLPTEWEAGRFAQPFPKGYNGWRLSECAGCEQVTWSPKMPDQAQRIQKMCDRCFRQSSNHHKQRRGFGHSDTGRDLMATTIIKKDKFNRPCRCGCGAANEEERLPLVFFRSGPGSETLWLGKPALSRVEEPMYAFGLHWGRFGFSPWSTLSASSLNDDAT